MQGCGMTLFAYILERHRAALIAELSRATMRCDTQRVHRIRGELKRVTVEALREEVA